MIQFPNLEKCDHFVSNCQVGLIHQDFFKNLQKKGKMKENSLSKLSFIHHEMNENSYKLQEIKMNYIELDNITIPIQYDIKSKKFSAKLYLKSYEINNK